MNVTIALHNGSQAHRKHNIRDEKVVSKEEHIDPNGKHENWIDEEPKKAYDKLFGQAVKDYNAKQTRPERQISNYYQRICNAEKADKKGAKHPVYEMIVGVYPQNKTLDEETQKRILKKFTDRFVLDNQEHIYVCGAYYHADEQGQPHVHIDYIPYADGYTKGMERQNGLDRALRQMGYEKTGKATPQVKWQAVMREKLKQICIEEGLTVESPRKDHRQHLDTATYKATQELKNLRGQIEESKEELQDVQGKIVEAKDIKEYKLEKDFLGRKTDFVKIPYEEYQDLYKTATSVKSVKEEKEKLNIQRDELIRDRQALNRDKAIQSARKQGIDYIQERYENQLIYDNDILKRLLRWAKEKTPDKVYKAIERAVDLFKAHERSLGSLEDLERNLDDLDALER